MLSKARFLIDYNGISCCPFKGGPCSICGLDP